MVFSKHLTLCGLAFAIVTPVIAGPYTLSQSNVGGDFYNNFQWQNIPDPTGGRVEYVTKDTALFEKLTSATASSFIMRADYKTILKPDGPGRMSNRIMSNAEYNTHVAVFDISHMPQGCATWPAIWEADSSVGTAAGEVDILEGVNDIAPDSVTLHTEGNCTMPNSRDQLGTSLSNDCSSSNDIGNGNNGCSVDAPYTSTYGPVFNQNGGGYYAVERTAEFISVWFWARGSSGIPSDVTSGATSIDTSNWGTPIANFPNTICNIGEVFSDNNIIIDLTFCGSWADSSFSNAGCGSNCTQFVNENPSAFENAYWDIAALRVYEPPADGKTASVEVARANTSSSRAAASLSFAIKVFTSPALIGLAILGGAWGLA